MAIACLCLHPGWEAQAANPVSHHAEAGVLVVVVQDDSGIPLPGAHVTATGPTGAASTRTDANGEARFEGLPDGTYEVTVLFAGFTLETHVGVQVLAGRTRTESVDLSVAAGAQEITIQARRDPVDVSDTSTSEVLTKDFLSRLPTGRSYQSSVGLSAGVTGQGGNRTISGGATNQNTYRLDGANITDPVAGALGPAPRAPGMPARPSTLYLSNDDSMSLASPQRLLYALERGLPFSPAQIRPHEVLNWFRFTRQEPADGEVFGLRSSARIEDETLTLAVTVTGARPERPPLDLTLLVDRSGSMDADGRIELVRQALRTTASHLRPGDRVDVVLFDDRVETVLAGYEIRRTSDPVLVAAIDRIATRGSTDLGLGLQAAYRLARSRDGGADRERRVMVFTDAEINSGLLQSAAVAEIGAALDESDIHLTGVGVGRDFRDDVLQALTEKGGGSYVFLGSGDVVDRLFGDGFDSLVHTVAEDVRFALTLPRGLEMERFYGEESGTSAEQVREVQFQAGSSQVFLQELRVTRLDPEAQLSLAVSWRDPGTRERRSRTFETSVGDLLESGTTDVDKAMALMAWTDLLQVEAVGGQTCGAPLATWRARSADFLGDPELAHVDALVRTLCPGGASFARVGR